MKILLVSAACGVGLVAVVACGGNTSGSGGGGGGTTTPSQVTSLDPSTPLSSLSASDATTLCENTSAFESSNATANDLCAILAIVAQGVSGLASSTGTADAGPTCASTYESCQKSLSQGTTSSGTSTTNKCSTLQASAFAGCTAVTVGDFAQCESDSVNALNQIGAEGESICSMILPDGGLSNEPTTGAANCALVREKCPAVSTLSSTLFGTSTSSSGAGSVIDAGTSDAGSIFLSGDASTP